MGKDGGMQLGVPSWPRWEAMDSSLQQGMGPSLHTLRIQVTTGSETGPERGHPDEADSAWKVQTPVGREGRAATGEAPGRTSPACLTPPPPGPRSLLAHAALSCPAV